MNKTEAIEHIRKTCGDGWLPLVEEVYEHLPPGMSVTQAFQKWGGLHFEYRPLTEEFEAYLETVENRSLEMCEQCGAAGSERIIDDWVHTRCDLHAEGAVDFS